MRHPYLKHLLEDISKAHRVISNLEIERPKQDEDNFETIERWLYEDPPNSFGDYCGLKVEDFPPSEQLSDEDMETVCKAFNKMMYSWNLDIDLPAKLPVPIAYTMTVDTLNQKTAIVNVGFMTFDYCSGSPEGCAFKAYCPCIDRIKDIPEDMDLDIDDDEQPY